MIFKKKLLFTAVVVSSALLAGCSTHSDRLGVSGQDEATQT